MGQLIGDRNFPCSTLCQFQFQHVDSNIHVQDIQYLSFLLLFVLHVHVYATLACTFDE